MIRKSGYRFSLATKREAFARRSCSNKKIEQDDDSKKSHHALIAPDRKRVVEGALSRRALLDRDNGAALVGVDQRHVEPGALLQELDIALAIGIDVRQSDQK